MYFWCFIASKYEQDGAMVSHLFWVDALYVAHPFLYTCPCGQDCGKSHPLGTCTLDMLAPPCQVLSYLLRRRPTGTLWKTQAGRASEELKQNVRLEQSSRLTYYTDFTSVRPLQRGPYLSHELPFRAEAVGR